ncbi:MAG: hypothetical protein F4Z85_09975 [Gemmatimonadetes bacterium]|nr:hypothetical protein [Gemmatimonadota bacterium]MYA23833.1 hypothetical protein [Gemmatimonadota bacterium]MYB71022.1 hypothetical protein [Gemmatimonadota bacterium]
MKSIMLSADEHLIEAAYQRAEEEHTTLNEQFQLWLKYYVQHEQQARYRKVPPEAQGTLADFLQGHIGILHSSEYMPGGARMSVDSGKKFAAGLLKQRR